QQKNQRLSNADAIFNPGANTNMNMQYQPQQQPQQDNLQPQQEQQPPNRPFTNEERKTQLRRLTAHPDKEISKRAEIELDAIEKEEEREFRRGQANRKDT